MSADGNTIGFETNANNLVQGDTNNLSDVFVHVFSTNATSRLSVKPGGGQVFGDSYQVSLSADGSKAAFASDAPDLVANDTNGFADVFVRNRSTDTVVRASLYSPSFQIASESSSPSLSDDGTAVAFTVYEPNVIVDDANQDDDVFVRKLLANDTTLVSMATSTATGNGGSSAPALSGDATVVAYRSFASDIVRNDTNGTDDVFALDLAVDLAPFGSADALVKQQFVDFLGRQPTAAELAERTTRIYQGEQTPDQLIDELAHGTTFAGKRAPLIRLYWAFFLRAPDKPGLDYWTKRLTNGASLASVAKQFAASSEFQSKYGSKTNQQFVTLIYQNIFDRDPDAGGLAYWTNKLDTKQKTRGDVMVNFSESSEGKRVLAPQTDTILVILGMLRAMPSKLFLDLLLGSLKGEWVPEVLVASQRTGAAYAARVTP